MILPAHVHGDQTKGLRLSARDPVQIGIADIVFETAELQDVFDEPEKSDLSLGYVRGALTQDCGPDWSTLPRNLSEILEPGMVADLIRYQQGSIETLRMQAITVSYLRAEFAPAEDESREVFAGTSGAFLFDEGVPIAMVYEADGTQSAWALRMDEIVARLARFIGTDSVSRSCDDPDLPKAMRERCDEVAEPDTVANPLDVSLVAWSAQPISPEFEPSGIVSGSGPYIAHVSPDAPLILEFETEDIVELSSVSIVSNADGETTFAPRSIEVQVDSSTGTPRPRSFLSRDAPPDGKLKVQRSATFARRIIIRIYSTWGGSPVRIDAIQFE